MKVIDLLEKIANEDEIPEKIKYKDYIYWYDKNWKDYKNAQVEFTSYLISCKYHTTDFLNEEVEIIEDTPKEDKKLAKIDLKEIIKNREAGVSNDTYLACFINEIIDKINGDEENEN